MQTKQNKLENFIGKLIGDLGAGITGALVLIGDRLGLYKAMADIGPCTPDELAKATRTDERSIREWLANQAAAGYILYDSTMERFILPEEHAQTLADEQSPFHMIGGFYNLGSVYRDEDRLAESFRSGRGFGWEEHHSCLFCGTAKFFRSSYEANLLQHWIPALEGTEERLRSGIEVADVGCGYGESTLIMAKAFPNSQFVGFDLHEGSIEHASAHAERLGLKNARFETATAKEYPGRYDWVTCFDCLHDMGDPVGSASYIHASLRPGGSCMLVEPFAEDRLEKNFTPVGRVFYGFSAAICVPASLKQEVGAALGAQAGPSKIRAVLEESGFQTISIAVESPLNLVFEARKQGNPQ